MKPKLGESINKLLRIVGLRIAPALPPIPILYPPAKAERDALSHLLHEFAAEQNTIRKGSVDPTKWQEYLSDRRLSFFRELLDLSQKNNISLSRQAILDFGSGTGYLLRLIDQQSEPVALVGIDSWAKFNALGKRVCPTADFYESFSETDQQFDLIFCTEVLEHLTEPQRQMQVFYERLTPSGVMVLTVPNGRIDSHEAKGLREDGTGYWGHINFWSPESWTIFINHTFPNDIVLTGTLSSRDNYAIIKKRRPDTLKNEQNQE